MSPYRHFGDLGNVEEDTDGVVETSIKDYLASLLGPFSVLGRAIVVSFFKLFFLISNVHRPTI